MFLYILFYSSRIEISQWFCSAHFTDKKKKKAEAHRDLASLTSYLFGWDLNPRQSPGIFSFSKSQVKEFKTACLICFLLLQVTNFEQDTSFLFLKANPRHAKWLISLSEVKWGLFTQGNMYLFLNAELDLPKSFLCLLSVGIFSPTQHSPWTHLCLLPHSILELKTLPKVPLPPHPTSAYIKQHPGSTEHVYDLLILLLCMSLNR